MTINPGLEKKRSTDRFLSFLNDKTSKRFATGTGSVAAVVGY